MPTKAIESGCQEAATIADDAMRKGAVETTKQEIQRERDFIADANTRLGTVLRAGQTSGQLVAVMLTITVAAAIGFVGTKVISELDSSITDKNLSDTDAANQTVYENASESVGSGFADAMGLTDIVFLVLMFGVILGALLAFRGR